MISPFMSLNLLLTQHVSCTSVFSTGYPIGVSFLAFLPSTVMGDGVLRALDTMLVFLSKQTKLDVKTYQQIEDMQIANFIKQVAGSDIDHDTGTALCVRLQDSKLDSKNTAAVTEAVSAALCKTTAKTSGKRHSQELSNGFLNYLTKQDRVALSDDGSHPFSRLSVPVKRSLQVGLCMPDEKTIGHIVATLCDNFGMGDNSKAKHELVVEYKKLIRGNRQNHVPAITKFPADPRELPNFEALYSAEERSQLPAASVGSSRPGKWLRRSSSQLTPNRRVQEGDGDNVRMDMMKMNMMMMLNMLKNGDDDGQLANLQIFGNPQKKRRLSLENGQGEEKPAVQDNTATGSAVRHQPFEVPAIADAEPNKATPDHAEVCKPEAGGHDPAKHHAEMQKALELRTEQRASEPKPKAKAKGKAKCKPKAAPSAKQKAGAKSKAVAKSKAAASKAAAKPASKLSKATHGKRPAPIPKGGSTCFYRQGKVHRSDTGQCWRVFRNAGDRCDLKVHWKGDLVTAWSKALDIIDNSA